MALPLKILNRLRLGRDLAARVLPTRPENLAWVYVYPILNPENGYLLPIPGSEGRIVGFGTGNPIKGFLVRHLEIQSRVAEDFSQSIRDDTGNPLFDERLTPTNEAELETVLARWVTDYMTLHVPQDVGYLFEEGPDLIRQSKCRETGVQ